MVTTSPVKRARLRVLRNMLSLLQMSGAARPIPRSAAEDAQLPLRRPVFPIGTKAPIGRFASKGTFPLFGRKFLGRPKKLGETAGRIRGGRVEHGDDPGRQPTGAALVAARLLEA